MYDMINIGIVSEQKKEEQNDNEINHSKKPQTNKQYKTNFNDCEGSQFHS